MSLRGLLAIVVIAFLAAAAPLQAVEPASPDQSCHPLTGDWAPVQRVCISTASYYADVCDAIERLAHRWSLPSGYFARLIWQESRFDPNAVSPSARRVSPSSCRRPPACAASPVPSIPPKH